MSDIKKKNDLLKTANTYIGKRGYIIRKGFLTPEQINEVKSELTVKPFVAADYGGGESNAPFPIYLENENKLYVPKFYGVEKFGKAQINTVPGGKDINIDLDNLEQYIKVINKKDGSKFIRVIVEDKKTSFVGKYETIDQFKLRAIEFQKSVKNSATLPN